MEKKPELNPGDVLELSVTDAEDGLRLDQFLVKRLGDLSSRSRIQKWIESDCITVGSVSLRSSTRIKSGECYRVQVPFPVLPDLDPVDLHLRVLYEDSDLAVIVKPPGIAVHPGPGESRVTLINGLLYLWRNLPEHTDRFRPGIVHRLDRDTEGIMVVAKNEQAMKTLSLQFHDRIVYKEYLAWVRGVPALTGEIKTAIERHPVNRLKMRVTTAAGRGREAHTTYELMEHVIRKSGEKFSLLKVVLKTGRTHQIRLHLSHIRSPIVGDPLYSADSDKFSRFGLLLLSRRIEFFHPSSKEKMGFEIEPPARFEEFRKLL